MKWIKDNTDFHNVYLEPDELNYECNLSFNLFLGKYGSVSYPISTNDLTILIEQNFCLRSICRFTDEGQL